MSEEEAQIWRQSTAAHYVAKSGGLSFLRTQVSGLLYRLSQAPAEVQRMAEKDDVAKLVAYADGSAPWDMSLDGAITRLEAVMGTH